jgi:tRNA(Ile)-lysidine synthase
MDLAARVLAFFQEQSLLGTTGVVAVSGGPDSVALAHLLVGLLRDGKLSALSFAHLNHQLRGADSDGDEAFVVGLPSGWDAASVNCHSTRRDVAALAAEHGANLEDTARRQRFRWFADVARAERASWVATGHTADDQAETVLMRLLRGSGLQGLSGMPLRRPLEGIELIRPLLSVRRHEIHRYLEENHLTYRDDASNRDPRFTRNRLRHDLIPHLQQHYNPAIIDVLCRLAAQAQGVQAELSTRAAALLQEAELPRAGTILVFRAASLTAQPVHVQAEIFRQVWRREGWPLDAMGYEDWQRLAGVIAGTQRSWDFPGHVRARRMGAVLQLIPIL